MDAIKYIIGNFGKFLRIFFKIRFPKTIYKSMGFKGIFSISLNKQKIIFTNFRDEISNDIFYSGIFGNYEGFSLKIWNHLCLNAQKSYVLDIGGYTGVYSLIAASANSEIHIETFEPHPKTFLRLQKNIHSNNYKNITLNNFALSDRDGDITFYNSKGISPSGFSSINHDFIEKDSGTMICKGIDISNLFQKNYINKKISLIKIDVERAELPLLNLIMDRIIRDKTCVLCEVLDYESYKNFDELFSKNNYHSIIIDDKKHTAVRVKELNGQKKIGDNILFIPSDKALDLNNL